MHVLRPIAPWLSVSMVAIVSVVACGDGSDGTDTDARGNDARTDVAHADAPATDHATINADSQVSTDTAPAPDVLAALDALAPADDADVAPDDSPVLDGSIRPDAIVAMDAVGPRDVISVRDAAVGRDAVVVDARRDAGSDARIDGGRVPWDPRSHTPPPAKGIWIWYFSYTGLTAAELAQRAQADGIGYVLIKSGQDGSYWDTRYTAANVREFTSRGIAVFAWPYVTPSNVTGSITAVAQAARVAGTAGVILDVEVEFEGSHATAAQQLCQGIRAAVPGVFLGYTSFGWVGYHGTFPFSTFDRYCGDVFMPQVYWSDRGVSWTYGYDQAVQQLAAAHLTAPVWMIQSNDDFPRGGAPTVTDLNAFFGRAGVYSSLWEWPASGLTAKSTQLPLLHWAN